MPSPEAVFQHCLEVHSFELLQARVDAHLGFYDTLRLINVIRSQPVWSYRSIFGSKRDPCLAARLHTSFSRHSWRMTLFSTVVMVRVRTMKWTSSMLRRRPP